MNLSLLLPCYKPVNGWEQIAYDRYTSFATAVKEEVELIIIVDGDSGNVSADSLNFLQGKISKLLVVQYEVNRGKGYALRQGVAKATGDIIMYTDIDFPYTEPSMTNLYFALRHNECDAAIGIKDNAYYTHVPFLRKVISRVLRFFIGMFLSMPITDTQCGLKGFKRSVAPVFLATTIDRYLFDLEFVRNCFKAKCFRVKAVPVTLNENVHFRRMDYRILLPEMLNFIKLLFK